MVTRRLLQLGGGRIHLDWDTAKLRYLLAAPLAGAQGPGWAVKHEIQAAQTAFTALLWDRILSNAFPSLNSISDCRDISVINQRFPLREAV
jgi:hypothetical protein